MGAVSELERIALEYRHRPDATRLVVDEVRSALTGDLYVTIVASTQAFSEAMFKLHQAFVAGIPAIRRWQRAHRLAFPPNRIHRNARRRRKRARRGR